MVAVKLPQILSTLITANHILDYQQVLENLGHISVRNSLNNGTFFMTGSPTPALVASVPDLKEFYIADGSPANSTDVQSPYSERFIHQGILTTYVLGTLKPTLPQVLSRLICISVTDLCIDEEGGFGLKSKTKISEVGMM